MSRSSGAIRKMQDSRRLAETGGPAQQPEAGRLESQASAELMVDESAMVKSHGEAVLRDVVDSSSSHWAFVDTLRDPGLIAVDASEQRLERVRDAGVLELALDASESVKAGNSIEKMLVHQMAACHEYAMRLLPKAIEQRDANNMAKYVTASARLMDVYRESMLALHRAKAGGRQTVTVVHVHEGAQAVVGAVPGGSCSNGDQG
jgi:hypothetical protein